MTVFSQINKCQPKKRGGGGSAFRGLSSSIAPRDRKRRDPAYEFGVGNGANTSKDSVNREKIFSGRTLMDVSGLRKQVIPFSIPHT